MKLFKNSVSFVIEQFKFTNCSFESVNDPCYAVFTMKKKEGFFYEKIKKQIIIHGLEYEYLQRDV